MSKTLILTEKPSVAKNIADALKIKSRQDGYFEGNDYIITWAFGHLLQLFDAKDYDEKMAKWRTENFPFIPDKFRYKVKSNQKNRDKEDLGAKKQLKIIYSLIKRNDVTNLISACDYDREGQIIGDTILYKIRHGKKVYRLLLNEWTPNEILKGLNNIISNDEMIPLRNAGIGRQWADWTIGINLTSMATLKYQEGKGQALNIGRVLLPTLKIIYDRDKEIENFVPEDYFKLKALFATLSGSEYEGIYHLNNEDKFKDKQILMDIHSLLSGKEGAVSEKNVEKKNEYPPYLFNLSNLQGFITNKYQGWTSDKVLRISQSLYEKKLITYPRTSSNFLDESLVERAENVLNVLKKGLPYESELRFTRTKRVFNNEKVESHSAIIPTYLVPKSLTKDEMIVYNAVKNRFLMQFMPIAEYEETTLTTIVNNVEGEFLSKGRVQLVEGWKKVEEIETKESTLPFVEINENVTVKNHEVTANKTKPPKYHTEKTLLRVMETCGKKYDDSDDNEIMNSILNGFSIGTPATRAETIKKLKDVGYITTHKKYLQCTELGKQLVEMFPVKELFDLGFTGKLEKTLHDIEKGKLRKEEFLNFIFDFTNQAVVKIKEDQGPSLKKIPNKNTYENLGSCPNCKHPVIEGEKGFGCSNWKNGCKFVIWKNDKYLASMKKKPTKTMVKSLLKNGVVLVKGLTSKKGKKFDANLRYEKNSENDYYSWKMEFDK
ncbi:type IA DNA topoisomerase [Robertmurraya yapensis]|uniref:DNA topoisomerase n=2 Tax=Bacillaceae TaxID=186817 RepID=A0A431W510_9BACI|nr:type IA DNA topoisomerase [Bacillus yapensis]RTR30522.1 type IA DNA topoisomerase [Bacillus yapensis]TKS95341.1 type IA DNA topoisomerase [Bacillus yapensis]